ncbi:MAG: mannose-1-phosphate guanylyltransferase [Patescibacteria group bacterium]
MQIVISCGGGGTRLWPLSNQQTPKQFAPILDGESLLAKTYRRLTKKFNSSQIWVTTNQLYRDLVIDILPEDFDSSHVLTEPEKRDTFAAIAAGAAVVAKHTSRQEPLIFLPCDDWLPYESDEDKFNDSLLLIEQALNSDNFDFVTVGIKPAYPNPQLGHLEIDSELSHTAYQEVVPVKSFKEKPDMITAVRFAESGNYFWHKHNPSFTFDSLVRNLKLHMQEAVEVVEKIYTDGEIDPVTYGQLPKTSIDYAMLEKAERIGMIAMDIVWEDIGNWEVVNKYLPGLDTNVKQFEIMGQGNKVKLSDSSRKVAFVGVSNLMLIESPEGILVIDPRYNSETKKVAEYFENLKEEVEK